MPKVNTQVKVKLCFSLEKEITEKNITYIAF